MGILLERMIASPRVNSYLKRETLIRVEADVCRRLGVRPNAPALASWQVEGFSFSGRARSSVDGVSLSTGADLEFAYAQKSVHHLNKAWISGIASARELGPRVLNITGQERKAEILEEYYPQKSNLRERSAALTADEQKALGREMAGYFVRSIMPEDARLVDHNDERPEHVFLLGQGAKLQLRLIDWGRGDAWPLERFDEWSARQFHWMYNLLSRDDPFIWHDFMTRIACRMKQQDLAGKLALGYMGFFLNQTYEARGNSWLRPWEARFIDLCCRLPSWPIKLEPVERFFQEKRAFSGESLARELQAWWWGSGQQEVAEWIELSK